jgi:pimeloyl-ACP methyl ester carboxylesterase
VSETVTANGLEFAYLSAGDGPLALCLHGFPDSAQTWRHLLPALADAGLRAVAPWSRGYAPTAVPADGDYTVAALAADANALHEALGGGDDAVLIGHDWGAITAYGAAALAPDRWRRVVTMAVPPPPVASAAFFDYRQPLAEMVVGADDLAFIDELWRDWSPAYDGRDDLPHVKDALRRPENLAAAIGYYRAMFGGGMLGETPAQPTLYLHGADDGAFLSDRVPEASAHLSADSQVEVVPGTGHFLHLEQPDTVNKRVVDWVTRSGA